MNEEQFQPIASRYGFSLDAVRHLYQAMQVGRGTMAQFSHPELGGTGQWMRGGMLMIGDMFNSALKARVEALCTDLAQLPRADPSALPEWAFPPSPAAAGWWPADLGQPASVGGQNDLAYAYFPARQRLAVHDGGAIRIYDTSGYAITGFSQQQQPGIQGLYFGSQRGVIAVVELPQV